MERKGKYEEQPGAVRRLRRFRAYATGSGCARSAVITADDKYRYHLRRKVARRVTGTDHSTRSNRPLVRRGFVSVGTL